MAPPKGSPFDAGAEFAPHPDSADAREMNRLRSMCDKLHAKVDSMSAAARGNNDRRGQGGQSGDRAGNGKGKGNGGGKGNGQFSKRPRNGANGSDNRFDKRR